MIKNNIPLRSYVSTHIIERQVGSVDWQLEEIVFGSMDSVERVLRDVTHQQAQLIFKDV